MIRAAILASALFAAPALAAPQFAAQPNTAPATTKFVVKDTLWSCGEAGCAASSSNSRPAVVCASLAKAVGALASFSVKGQALSADELGKCNARAKKIADGEVRTAEAN